MGTAEEVRIRQPCMVRWGGGGGLNRTLQVPSVSICQELHQGPHMPEANYLGSQSCGWEPGWGARRTLKQNSDVPRITERGQGVQIHRKGHWAPRQAQNDHPRLSQTAETGTAKQPGHSLEVTIRKQGALSNST